MQDHLHQRLEELKKEFQIGQDRLAALEKETSAVKNSMLRISGAIQVLEELLEKVSTQMPENDNYQDQTKPSESG